MIVQSTSLTESIETARRRSVAWLDSMQAADEPRGVMRISSHHDVERWPDMLLPGTYNGLMCRHLIEGLDDLSGPEQTALVHWLEGFRVADGRFRMGSMKDDDVFKKPDKAETWRYIDFHVTNYTLGAIEALDPRRRPVLDFARPYLDERTLGHWLSIRDLRDPWQEGNNIVNLASFLLLLCRHGEGKRSGNDLAPAVDGTLARLFEWHERLQEPATGFWGVGQLSDATRLKDAFAGSMHNFHVWYEAGRPLPYQERAIDYCLSLPPKVDSACIDVDAVDLLVHAWRLLDYRRRDIEAWLAALLPALLADQNPRRRVLRRARGGAPAGRMGGGLRGATRAVQHLRDLVSLDRNRDDYRRPVPRPVALAVSPHDRHRLPHAGGSVGSPPGALTPA